MSSPLAGTFVEITLDERSIDTQIARLERSLSDITANIHVTTDSTQIRPQINSLLATLPDGKVKISPDLAGGTFATELEKEAGDAGKESGTRFTTDMTGRLRDERGRFVAAGKDSADAVATGARESGAASSAGSSVGSKFSAGLATALTAATVATGAAGIAITAFGLKSAASLEQTQVSFNALTGSAANGLAMMQNLQKFAAETPFEFPDVAHAAQRLLAMGQAAGIAQGDVQNVLTTIGNVASVTGGGAQALDSVTLAMGQIASSGKVTLDNLNQISESMPGFSGVAAIAAAKGITTAQAMDLISTGSLSAQDGIAALLKGMQQFPGAAGAMVAQGQTLLGVFSTFKDTIGQSLSGGFTNQIPAIKDALTGLTPVIGQVISTIAPALGTITSGLLQQVGTVLQGISGLLAPILNALGTALGGLNLAPLVSSFSAVGAALAPLVPVIGQLANIVVTVLAAGLQVLAAVLGPVIKALSDSLLPILPQITAAITQLTPLIVSLAAQFGAALGNALQQLLPALLQVVPVIINSLLPALIQLLPTLAPLAVVFAQLLTVLVQLLVPLLNASAAFTGWEVLNILVPVIKLFAEVTLSSAEAIGALVGWLGKIDWGGTGSSISGAFSSAWKSVQDFFTGILDAVSKLPGQLVGFLSSIPATLQNLIVGAFQSVFEGIGNVIGSIIAAAIAFPGQLVAAVASIKTLLSDFFTSVWNGIIFLFTDGINQAVTFLGSLPGRALTAIASLYGLIVGVVTNTFNTAKQTVSDGVESVIGFIFSIPGRIASLGGTMLNAGRNLINQLLSGLSNAGSGAFAFVNNIISGIRNFINNNVLGALERGINDKLPFDIHLPRLARGDIVDKPTVALIGEAGPEVVLPLNDPRRANELLAQSGLQAPGSNQPIILNARIWVGDREITDIVRVETDRVFTQSADALAFGQRF